MNLQISSRAEENILYETLLTLRHNVIKWHCIHHSHDYNLAGFVFDMQFTFKETNEIYFEDHYKQFYVAVSNNSSSDCAIFVVFSY